MPLTAIIDKLDDAPEAIRSEYRPGTKEEGLEGRFVLNVTAANGWALEDVSGLKTALSTERGEVARLKGSTKAFDGLDADDVRKKLAKLDELLKVDPKTEADRIANEKIEAAKAQLVAAHENEIKAARERGDKAEGYAKKVAMSAAVNAALAKADALNPEALALKIRQHVRLKETGRDDDPYTVEVVDANGNPMIGDSKGGAMTLDGFVTSLRNDATWATSFKPAGKQGSGAQHQNGAGGNAINRAAFDALSPGEQHAHIKAGGKVTD